MSEQKLPYAVQIHPAGTRIVLTDVAKVEDGQETAGVTGKVIPYASRQFTKVALDTPVDGCSTLLLAPDEFTLLEPAG